MLHGVDVAMLAAFVFWAAFSGFRNRRVASQGLEEYFLAGRSLSGWRAGLSMAATQFAADTPLLVTGMIAMGGLFSLWRLWIYALSFLLMGFVLGRLWRRAGVLTDAELAEIRYGDRWSRTLRVAKAVYFGTVFNCAVIAMVLLAATRIAEPFLRWDLWLPPGLFQPLVDLMEWSGLVLTVGPQEGAAVRSASNFLSLAAVVMVTVLYSTTGGLRSVVSTDLVQLAVAMLGTAFYAGVVVARVGGLGGLREQLMALYGPDGYGRLLGLTPGWAPEAGGVVLGTIGIQWLAQMNADGTGYLAQRTMACRSDGDARLAAVVFTVVQIVFRSLFWMAIALALLVLLPLETQAEDPLAVAAAREVTFVEGIVLFLPSGARGLMLVGLLAALASTLDTHLNWGASYWTNDLYKGLICEGWLKRQPSPRRLVWVARMSNLCILLLACIVLTQLQSIQAAWRVTLLLGAGMGVPLILRWLWWRVTAAAELGALVVSLVAAPLLLWWSPDEGPRILVMAGLSTVVTVVLSVQGGPAARSGALAFYQRVHPVGFWGPVAQAAGDDPKKRRETLAWGLFLTLGTALACFSALVGLSGWLFGSPSPWWIPWPHLWRGGLLALALGWAVFLFCRRGFILAGAAEGEGQQS